MTNKQLILLLLDSDLNAEADIKRTVGDIEFKPEFVGKWAREGQYAVYCSRCNCRVSLNASKAMNYCFNCGARMENDTNE